MSGSYICDDYYADACPCRPANGGGAIYHGDRPAGLSRQLWGGRHCYHESTRRRLEWQYGENRTNASDIAAWNSLGQRHEAAA